MKKSVIGLLGMALFLLSGTVFATNWIYIRSDNGIDGFIKVYIDADSVVRNGDDLIYWGCALWDQPVGNDKGEETRYEVKLINPRMYRELDMYKIDVDNNLYKDEDSNYPSNWYQITNYLYNQEIDIALQYAKIETGP